MQVEYLDGRKERGRSELTRPGLVHIIHENGDIYEGNVIQTNGGEYVPHGKGKYEWKTGAWYEGQYDHGSKNGLGAYHYPNGTVYRGSWKNGVKSGPGTITYTNGDTFSGAFADDMKNGKGCYTYASTSAQLMGEWHHGEVVSGKWIFPKGDATLGSQRSLKGAALIPPSLSAQSKQGNENDKPESKTPPSSSPLKDAKPAPLGIIISGAPASGKGTQCERLREEFGLVHLSTGDMLRAAVAAGTEIGIKAKEIMEAGGLVPDEIVIGAIKERLAQPDVQEHGFLLDGFPRTPAQAQALKELGVEIHVFLMLDVPDEMILERVTGRRVDPETGNSYHVKFKPPPTEIEHRLIQRKDDTEDCVKPRLQNFHQNIASVRGQFEQVLVEVDGTGKPHEVWSTIQDKLTSIKNTLLNAGEQ